MSKYKFSIIDVDTSCHVAFSDEGHILEVESYVDENDDPCLPEDAVAVYVMVGNTRFERFEIEKEDEHWEN